MSSAEVAHTFDIDIRLNLNPIYKIIADAISEARIDPLNQTTHTYQSAHHNLLTQFSQTLKAQPPQSITSPPVPRFHLTFALISPKHNADDPESEDGHEPCPCCLDTYIKTRTLTLENSSGVTFSDLVVGIASYSYSAEPPTVEDAEAEETRTGPVTVNEWAWMTGHRDDEGRSYLMEHWDDGMMG